MFSTSSSSTTQTTTETENPTQSKKPYQCSKCDKSFSSSSNRARHAKNHVDSAENTCSFCGKIFFSISRLVHHSQLCRGEQQKILVSTPKKRSVVFDQEDGITAKKRLMDNLFSIEEEKLTSVDQSSVIELNSSSLEETENDQKQEEDGGGEGDEEGSNYDFDAFISVYLSDEKLKEISVDFLLWLSQKGRTAEEMNLKKKRLITPEQLKPIKTNLR